MNDWKKTLKNILSRDNVHLSSKRVITALAFLLMCAAFISNLYWGFKIDPVIYESMKWIVMTGLGTIASENFGRTNPVPTIPPQVENVIDKIDPDK